jgi:hypothetical protein
MRNSEKRYKDQYDCAHAWAHGLSHSGRASSLYFAGAVIYSYGGHFPIARIDGSRVYFTERTYSNTTAKHKSIVRSAASHLDFIYVQHVPSDHLPPKSDAYFLKRNIDHWVSEITRLMDMFRLHPKRASLLREIVATYRTLSNFIGLMGVIPSTLVEELAEKVMAEIMPALEAANKRTVERRSKMQATRGMAFTGTLKKWRKGEKDRLHRPHPFDGNLAFLRLNPDLQFVETSKNVRIPINEAGRFYRYILNFLEKGSGQPVFKIAGFWVTAIDDDYLTVGCHKIPMAEIDAIAKMMGWQKE